MTKVFIDGSEGTTGLRIADRLASRTDVELIKIDPEKRKDAEARAECINASDITFLCLPDAAAIEAVTLLNNDHTRIIDASTAHRTNTDWAYGFPELSTEHEDKIKKSRLVANPGCHASGFVALAYPLVQMGTISKDARLSCFSLTGYSGGGKKMIAEYESADRHYTLDSPRIYGVTQAHKHLKEMKAVCGLSFDPVFSPIVGDFYSGMAVTVPLDPELIGGNTAADIHKVYVDYYAGKKLIKVMPLLDERLGGFIPANLLKERDDMRIYVGGGERVTVTAVFDNLGKGASGAAIQNMNVMLGLDEAMGLNVNEEV